MLNLGTSAVAFLSAYALTPITVKWLDSSWQVVTRFSDWWREVLAILPGLNEQFVAGTAPRIGGEQASGGLARMVLDFIERGLLDERAFPGGTPTWLDVLSFSIGRMLVSAVVFLVIFALTKGLCSLLFAPLYTGKPGSLASRLLGAMIETALAALWLSIIAGTIYPVLASGFLGSVGKAISSSTAFMLLSRLFQILWPALGWRL